MRRVKSSRLRESRSSLGDDERLRVSRLQHFQRRLDSRPSQVLRRPACILDHFDQLPAAPLALGHDRSPLRLSPAPLIACSSVETRT